MSSGGLGRGDVQRWPLFHPSEADPDGGYRLHPHTIDYQDFRRPQTPYRTPGDSLLAKIGAEDVTLTTLKKARYADGWIARLSEIGGQDRSVLIAIPGKRVLRAWRTDLLEEVIGEIPVEPDGTLRVQVPAWGLTTVHFTLAVAAEGI